MTTTLTLDRLQIIHRGDYAGGTTYGILDVVYYQGSAWVYNNPLSGSGNAPPTLPTKQNSYWTLFSEGRRDLSTEEGLLTRRNGAPYELPVGTVGQALAVDKDTGLLVWTSEIGPKGRLGWKLPNQHLGNPNYTYNTLITQEGKVVVSAVSNSLGGRGASLTVLRYNPIGIAQGQDEPTLPFVQLVQNGRSAAALDSAGKVWTWGDNGGGQLGDGTTTTDSKMKKVGGLLADKVVTKIFGHQHLADVSDAFFAVTDSADDKRVYAWGYGDAGGLGIGTKTSTPTPRRVKDLTNVDFVYSSGTGTFQVTFFVLENKDMYGCGFNFEGTLGFDPVLTFGGADGSSEYAQLTPIKVLEGVVDVASNEDNNGPSDASGGRSIAVLEDGTVQHTGEQVYGEFGYGDTSSDFTSWAQHVDIDNAIQCWCVGGYYGQTMLLTSDGEIFFAGYNGYGMAGDGTTTTVDTYKEPVGGTYESDIRGNIAQMSVAASSNIATAKVILDNGECHSVGAADLGQSAQGTVTEPNVWRRTYSSKQDMKFVAIAPSSLYSWQAILEDGTVMWVGDNNSAAPIDYTTSDIYEWTETFFQ